MVTLLNLIATYITLNLFLEKSGLEVIDTCSPNLGDLHNNIMFYLAMFLIAVVWRIVSIIIKYNKYINYASN